MKKTSRIVSLLLSLGMVFSLAACGGSGDAQPGGTQAPDQAPSQNVQPSDTPGGASGGSDSAPTGEGVVAPIQPDAAGVAAKWSEKKTADGWMLVDNGDGEALGYSPKSGVQLIQVDGYAFKDLDKDGVLDGYEDWRNSDEVRARDLAAQMSADEMIPLFTFGGWSSFSSEIDSGSDDYAYIMAGGRGGVTRSAGSLGNTTMAVDWTNSLQSICEGAGRWGIPATVSIDPNNMSNTIDQMALGATMDPDVAFDLGKEVSKMWRSVGVTMLLGPQTDLATTPIVVRANGDYTEDPALNRDLVDAYISGLQSTWAEDGTDLGWGQDSVYGIVKHYAGAGAAEGGRNDHFSGGGFDVFPGNNFEAHLIGYFDAAFNLTRSITKASGVMPNYAASYSADGSLGEINGGAYSAYKMGLLLDTGYQGFIVTDWQITEDGGAGSYHSTDMTVGQRYVKLLKNGICSVGGTTNIEGATEGYELVVAELGEAKALELLRDAAYRFFLSQMQCQLYDNAYISLDNAQATVWNARTDAYAMELQLKSVIMLKNSGSTIAQSTGEKKTVYIPYVFTAASEATSSSAASPSSWDPAMDINVVSRYFNVVTDTVGAPSGTDADGNPSLTENDIIRASAEQLASCDMALVSISAPQVESSQADDGTWTAASLQFGAYTASTAREHSIAGFVENGVQEDRGYRGTTVGPASNYGDLEMLQSVKNTVPASCKVVLLVEGKNPMVFSEVEPLSDVILWYWGNSGGGSGWFYDEALLKIVAGEVEPSGLLNMQMPANMETVEAQLEDVPRDMECYVDADGNTYDFTFGLNWSGKIDDARVRTYNVAPITKCQNINFHYAS